MPEKPVEESSVRRPNESLVCDVCGQFGALEFGDRLICPDCYGQNCGSCCPEFGKEDPAPDSDHPGSAGARSI